MTEHWTTYLLYKPYSREASQGPDSFNCWGLTRWVFKHHRDIDLPLVNVGADEQEAAIREVTRVGRFRAIPLDNQLPKDFDIVTMKNEEGPHVGTAHEILGRMYLLHAMEQIGVRLTPYRDLWLLGYTGMVSWRQA